MTRSEARRLVGKTIAAVDLRPFSTGRQLMTSDPLITFTDGSTLHFEVDETEGNGYGVDMIFTPLRRRRGVGR